MIKNAAGSGGFFNAKTPKTQRKLENCFASPHRLSRRSRTQADGDLALKFVAGRAREEKIPKGFRPSAQRCHDAGAATLGGESEIEIYPNGVVARAR